MDFKQKFTDNYLELLWAQWRALGVSAYGDPSTQLLDLEALILATEAAGLRNRRLEGASRQWLISFPEWINLSRIMRMGMDYSKEDPLIRRPLIESGAWLPFVGALKTRISLNAQTDTKFSARNDSVVTPPRLKLSSLIQLNLRAIFGVNARAEIFLYLLLERSGNSNGIAREIGYDQKIAYRILERWAEAGFITRETGARQNLYSLAPGNTFIANMKPANRFWRWQKFFLFQTQILSALWNKPWNEDAYLLSSLFRDLYPDAVSVAWAAGFSLPDPKIYAGEAYFEPMAASLLDLLDHYSK